MVLQNLHYKFFLGNRFLLDCNHSLANSLLHHELKCLDWIGLWWWWFQVTWVILISLIRMDWCGYSFFFQPICRAKRDRFGVISASQRLGRPGMMSIVIPKSSDLTFQSSNYVVHRWWLGCCYHCCMVVAYVDALLACLEFSSTVSIKMRTE